MGERLLCKHQVIGSIPIGSTSHAVSRNSADEQQFSRDEDNSFAYRLTVRGWGISPALTL
jgi:hypothetical protein